MMNILVIEDNPGDAETIKVFLEDAGFKHRFYHSTSLNDGLNILQDNGIDLVLLDLSLNDTMGFNTLRQYLEEAPNIPVIILTGNKNEVVGMQSVRAGAQDFLVKGEFGSKRLVSAIRFSLQRFKKQHKLQQAAEQLIINKKRFQEAQEMAHLGNWEMDIVNNTMVWSEEMFRIFGVTPNSLTPSLTDYLEYVHVEDREKVERFFEEAIKTGKPTRTEHRILINNRILKHLTVQAKVNFDQDINKILLIGSVQDFTFQKNGNKARPSDDPASPFSPFTGETFSRLGFNLRTPLNSMINLLFLLEKSKVSYQQMELLQGLKTSVDDLSIVLNNLLNFILLQTENLAVAEGRFNFRELLGSVERICSFKAKQADLAFSFDVQSDFPPNVTGDEQKVLQIIHNLIEQAIFHTAGKSAINITVSHKESGKDLITFQIVISYRGKLMTISGDPESLSAEPAGNAGTGEQATIFPPQLSNFVALHLTEMLKGELRVFPQEDNLVKIQLHIPLRSKAPQQAELSDKPTHGLNILLAEDHAINQIATKRVLTSWSDLIGVDIAVNGTEAVRKFQSGNYDLILMDLQMPEMDGMEATEEIRKMSTVPVIALTASPSKQEEERCRAAGMDDYLAKPFRPAELYGKIMRLTQP